MPVLVLKYLQLW